MYEVEFCPPRGINLNEERAFDRLLHDISGGIGSDYLKVAALEIARRNPAVRTLYYRSIVVDPTDNSTL